jgi:hypothetical protein
MKSLMILGTLLTLTSAAQAAPVSCTTNVNRVPGLSSTSITIEPARVGQTEVTIQSFGGMAHYVTAPKTFAVNVQARGPEMVEYYNTQEDFDLVVVYQPIGGQIHGTLTTEVLGQRIEAPVVCVAAMN